MRFAEEPPTAILGAAVRALEALGKEVNEGTLLEATRSKGINRRQVQDFLAKVERGQKPATIQAISKRILCKVEKDVAAYIWLRQITV